MPEATQNESSALFSLKELMVLEEDRLKDEERTLARREEEARRLRESELAAARTREEAARREAEERRGELERRRREEETRLDAIRVAELEKHRIEAERRASLEASSKSQEHERALARIAEDAASKRLRRALRVTIVSSILVASGLAAGWWLVLAPAMARREAAERVALDGAQDDAGRAKRDAEALQKRVDDLLREKRDLDGRAVAPPVAASATPTPPGHRIVTDVKPPTKETGVPCSKADPLCGLNGRIPLPVSQLVCAPRIFPAR